MYFITDAQALIVLSEELNETEKKNCQRFKWQLTGLRVSATLILDHVIWEHYWSSYNEFNLEANYIRWNKGGL